MTKRITFALTLLFLAVVGTSSASAHTTLITSNPKINSTISQLPGQISLTFDDPLLVFGKRAINSVQVLNPSGQVITASLNVVKGRVLTNKFKLKSAPDGKFRVSFRVVAQDGHVVTGGFEFSVKK